MIRRLLSILILAWPTLAGAQIIEFPDSPEGQVLDSGSWLGEDRQARLESELGRYRASYQVDVLVVLWDRGLPPATGLNELAQRLGETWAREDLWVVVLHLPDSLHHPVTVSGGAVTTRLLDGVAEAAVRAATLRGMKERTPAAQVEALALEAGTEFVFLKHRAELERKLAVVRNDQQRRDQERRHQAMIFRAAIATILALVAVGVVAVLYLARRRPSECTFPETRWRRRLGAKWSGGGQIVVSIPSEVS